LFVVGPHEEKRRSWHELAFLLFVLFLFVAHNFGKVLRKKKRS
jgi:hypothetical protein